MSKTEKTLKKLTPFKYPSKIHKRTETPPNYKNYRKYKPYLASEFNSTCVYCRKVFIKTDDPSGFHVEHYKPKSIPEFANLTNEYTNLYFSCAACNRAKKTYWHSKFRIANPCDFVMTHHLKFKNHVVVPNSDIGTVTEAVLKLNTENTISYREQLETILKALIYQLLNPPNISNKSELDNYKTTVSKTMDVLSDISKLPAVRIKSILNVKI